MKCIKHQRTVTSSTTADVHVRANGIRVYGASDTLTAQYVHRPRSHARSGALRDDDFIGTQSDIPRIGNPR